MNQVDWETPGLWAQSITEGRWQAYDHLISLDLALATAAYTPDSRVIVEMPPRHGKSTLSSVYFPSWYRLRWPERNIALWSATGKLAQRFSKHTRDVSVSQARQFGWSLDQSSKSWDTWKLADTPPNCGEFYSTGIGGGTTMGTGAHLLIIDDFFKDVESALSPTIRQKQEEWYLACVSTRLEPGASIVVIATRWHRDDLIGFVLREAEQTGEHWNRIRMQAIGDDGDALWPERFPLEKLRQIQRRFEVQGYPWMWEALYQQQPPETMDSEWDPSYFHDGIYFDQWPPEEDIILRIVCLDPSLGETEKADYSAFTNLAMTADGHFWIEADLARRDAIVQCRDAVQHIMAHRASAFVCEANGFQAILAPEYYRQAAAYGIGVPVWPVINTRGAGPGQGKPTRIRAFISPHLVAGRLHFRRNSPGTNLALEQLRGFPVHRYRDGPDSLAMAIQVANEIRFGQAADPSEEIALT